MLCLSLRFNKHLALCQTAISKSCELNIKFSNIVIFHKKYDRFQCIISRSSSGQGKPGKHIFFQVRKKSRNFNKSPKRSSHGSGKFVMDLITSQWHFLLCLHCIQLMFIDQIGEVKFCPNHTERVGIVWALVFLCLRSHDLGKCRSRTNLSITCILKHTGKISKSWALLVL